MHALTYGCEHGASDRRDFANGNLTACLIQKRLHVLEWHS